MGRSVVDGVVSDTVWCVLAINLSLLPSDITNFSNGDN